MCKQIAIKGVQSGCYKIKRSVSLCQKQTKQSVALVAPIKQKTKKSVNFTTNWLQHGRLSVYMYSPKM